MRVPPIIPLDYILFSDLPPGILNRFEEELATCKKTLDIIFYHLQERPTEDNRKDAKYIVTRMKERRCCHRICMTPQHFPRCPNMKGLMDLLQQERLTNLLGLVLHHRDEITQEINKRCLSQFWCIYDVKLPVKILVKDSLLIDQEDDTPLKCMINFFHSNTKRVIMMRRENHNSCWCSELRECGVIIIAVTSNMISQSIKEEKALQYLNENCNNEYNTKIVHLVSLDDTLDENSIREASGPLTKFTCNEARIWKMTELLELLENIRHNFPPNLRAKKRKGNFFKQYSCLAK